MNTFFKLIDVVFVAFVASLLAGCPDNKDGSDSDPGPATRNETGDETGPKPQV